MSVTILAGRVVGISRDSHKRGMREAHFLTALASSSASCSWDLNDHYANSANVAKVIFVRETPPGIGSTASKSHPGGLNVC